MYLYYFYYFQHNIFISYSVENTFALVSLAILESYLVFWREKTRNNFK